MLAREYDDIAREFLRSGRGGLVPSLVIILVAGQAVQISAREAEDAIDRTTIPPINLFSATTKLSDLKAI